MALGCNAMLYLFACLLLVAERGIRGGGFRQLRQGRQPGMYVAAQPNGTEGCV